MTAPGTIRGAAVFATCAAEPCGTDATIEALHAPTPGVGVWVPLCEVHQAGVLRGDGLEYVVEVHGFIPAARALPDADQGDRA